MKDMDKRYRYAWDWFDFHAKQRLTTFNFFLIIMGAIGYVYIFAPCNKLDNMLISWLAFTGAFISLLFLLLEVRNTILVDDGRDQLDKLEGKEPLINTAIRRSDLRRFFTVSEDKKNPGNSRFWRTCHVLSSHTFCLRLILSASVILCLYFAFYVNDWLDWYNYPVLGLIFITIFGFSIKKKVYDVIFDPDKLEEKLNKLP